MRLLSRSEMLMLGVILDRTEGNWDFLHRVVVVFDLISMVRIGSLPDCANVRLRFPIEFVDG